MPNKEEVVVKKDSLKDMGFVIDISLYTVGDILDLSDELLPIKQRLEILQHGIMEGDLRKLPVSKLSEFVEAISAAMTIQANPT